MIVRVFVAIMTMALTIGLGGMLHALAGTLVPTRRGKRIVAWQLFAFGMLLIGFAGTVWTLASVRGATLSWPLYMLEEHLAIPVALGLLGGVIVLGLLDRLAMRHAGQGGLLEAVKNNAVGALALAGLVVVPLLVVAVAADPRMVTRLRSVSLGGAALTLAEPVETRAAVSSAGDPEQTSIGTVGLGGQRMLALLDLTDTAAGSRGLLDRDRGYIIWTEAAAGMPRALPEPVLGPDAAILSQLSPAMRCVDAYIRLSGDNRVVVLENAGVVRLFSALELLLRRARLAELAGVATPGSREIIAARIDAVLEEFADRLASGLQTVQTDLLAASAASAPLGAPGGEPLPPFCQEATAMQYKVTARDGAHIAAFEGFSPYLALVSAQLFGGVGAHRAAVAHLAGWIDDFRRARETLAERSGGAVADAKLPLWLEARALLELFFILAGARQETGAPPLTIDFMEQMDARLRWLVAFREAELPHDRCLTHRTPGLAELPPERQGFTRAYSNFLWWYLTMLARTGGEPPLTTRHLEQARWLRDLDIRCMPSLVGSEADVQRALNRFAFARLTLSYVAQSATSGGLTADDRRRLLREAREAIYQVQPILRGEEAEFRRNRGTTYLRVALDAYPRTSLLRDLARMALELEALEE